MCEKYACAHSSLLTVDTVRGFSRTALGAAGLPATELSEMNAI